MDARRFVKTLVFTCLVLALVGGVSVALARGLAAPSTTPAAQSPLPVGFAFTYQGRLIDEGDPANGLYDFQFELFDSNNSPIGPVVTVLDRTVIGGLFTDQLDFGDVFDGRKLWLQIGVRPSGSSDPYTILSDRQELTAAPYALYALDVGVNYAGSSSKGGPALNLSCSGCVNSAEIENGTIAFADIGQNGCGPGQVMKWTGAEWSCSNAYARTVIVSPVGTPLENGAALLTALKGIADATVGNPYLLKIEPGRYALGSQPLAMKPWVDVEGSGELVTTITAPGSSSYETGTVVGSDNALAYQDLMRRVYSTAGRHDEAVRLIGEMLHQVEDGGRQRASLDADELQQMLAGQLILAERYNEAQSRLTRWAEGSNSPAAKARYLTLLSTCHRCGDSCRRRRGRSNRPTRYDPWTPCSTTTWPTIGRTQE